MDIINLICLIDVIIVLIFFLLLLLFGTKNKAKIKNKVTNDPHLAILIPARDESTVIEDLLISIENQSLKINSQDIYVIVENIEDQTVKICQKHNVNIFVRKNLKLKRKGYALDEVVQNILNKKIHYDLYYIFDADNILDKDFLKHSLISYYNGYDIMVGYRCSKNANENAVAASSSLIFSMFNVLINRKKLKYKKTINVTGTGFFIRGDILEKLQGYTFHTLTEDYELTLYAILNNLTSDYNEKCLFYDEQPITMKQTIVQRTRWIKGFFEARDIYLNKIVKSLKNGYNESSKLDEIFFIKLGIFIVFGIIICFLYNLIKYFIKFNLKNLITFLSILLIVYLVLMIFTYILIKKDTRLKLTFTTKIKALFFNPIYLASFVPCFFKAIFTKNINWEKIEHHKSIKT
jgi:cellulose synthase/poly-beta-1,6-N-acetylglucosamine synthase-like glycosyltransferase